MLVLVYIGSATQVNDVLPLFCLVSLPPNICAYLHTCMYMYTAYSVILDWNEHLPNEASV